MPPAVFELAIPASDRPQSFAFDLSTVLKMGTLNATTFDDVPMKNKNTFDRDKI
jgi:hypothetical protein